MLAGLVGQRLEAGGQFQQRVKPDMLTFAQQALGHTQCMARIGGDAPGQLVGFDQQRVVRYHAGDQADGQCFGGIDAVTGKSHFGSARHAHRARQQPGAAIARDQSELDETFGEAGALGSDADVTHASQIATGTDGRTVDGGNDGDVEVIQRQWQALYAFPIFLAQAHRTDVGTDLALHVADVPA